MYCRIWLLGVSTWMFSIHIHLVNHVNLQMVSRVSGCKCKAILISEISKMYFVSCDNEVKELQKSIYVQIYLGLLTLYQFLNEL